MPKVGTVFEFNMAVIAGCGARRSGQLIRKFAQIELSAEQWQLISIVVAARCGSAKPYVSSRKLHRPVTRTHKKASAEAGFRLDTIAGTVLTQLSILGCRQRNATGTCFFRCINHSSIYFGFRLIVSFHNNSRLRLFGAHAFNVGAHRANVNASIV